MYLCTDDDIPILSLENMEVKFCCFSFAFNVSIQYILDFYLR